MYYAGSLSGESAALLRRFKIGATVIAGQIVIYDTANNGTILDPTTSAAADGFGFTLDAGTYSTTQGATEGDAMVAYNPFCIIGGSISGGTADSQDVALSITSNATANTAGTTIADTALPGDSFPGGLVYGLTGNNKGLSRIATTVVSASSLVVTVPFPQTIAAADTFLVFAAAPGRTNLTITTNFDQCSQFYNVTSGLNCAVVDILIDDYIATAPSARCLFILRDHIFNPLS